MDGQCVVSSSAMDEMQVNNDFELMLLFVGFEEDGSIVRCLMNCLLKCWCCCIGAVGLVETSCELLCINTI
jgi:hypothetical protein